MYYPRTPSHSFLLFTPYHPLAETYPTRSRYRRSVNNQSGDC